MKHLELVKVNRHDRAKYVRLMIESSLNSKNLSHLTLSCETLLALLPFQQTFPGKIYASNKEIANLLGLKPSSIIYRIRKLKDHFPEFIHTRNSYTLSMKTGNYVCKREISINWMATIRQIEQEEQEYLQSRNNNDSNMLANTEELST